MGRERKNEEMGMGKESKEVSPLPSPYSVTAILLYFGKHCSNILTKDLFSNTKLPLEYREENIKGFSQGRTN